eukprot:CAMPEP_0172043832 /NCGR_PEP_ID=MMETSP1041-20130122/26472_1 /TAXON_ID=464988 /ORGANISM="Hemiselmis andersenii, Strain CCMP439" /LENGTH=257 /DNA_ID=CAMNT_0012702283 /DNA_START=85 /DNA_END=856 /DNA_ORIENTATION=+
MGGGASKADSKPGSADRAASPSNPSTGSQPRSVLKQPGLGKVTFPHSRRRRWLRARVRGAEHKHAAGGWGAEHEHEAVGWGGAAGQVQAETPGSTKKGQEEVDEAVALHVLQMAEVLEIDPVEEEVIMWVAEKAVATPVKPPWAKYLEKDGSIFYFNAETKASQWRHPYEQEWRNLVREEREKLVAVETTVEDEAGNTKAAVVYQREPTYVPDPKRYAVLVESLRPFTSVFNHLNPAPPEWGLIKVARETAGSGLAE